METETFVVHRSYHYTQQVHHGGVGRREPAEQQPVQHVHATTTSIVTA